MSRGYIYVLSNPSMPGVVKIGRSSIGGDARASQLYTTGVPRPFYLEFEILVPDAASLELHIHESLHRYRLHKGREFFRATPGRAIFIILGELAKTISNEPYNEQIASVVGFDVWCAKKRLNDGQIS